MTTVAEYLDASGDLAATVGNTPLVGVRTYVGATASEDALLRGWYSAAINWVNTTLDEHDFVDAAGEDANPPDQIVLGVYKFVWAERAEHKRSGGNAVGVTEVETGQRKEKYAAAGTASGGVLSAAMLLCWPNIEKYVEDLIGSTSGGGW